MTPMNIQPPVVPQSGAAIMPDASSFPEGLLGLLENALDALHPDLSEAAGISLSLIALILLVSIVGLIPCAKWKKS